MYWLNNGGCGAGILLILCCIVGLFLMAALPYIIGGILLFGLLIFFTPDD